MKARYESFGGIIAQEDPPLLAFVDQRFMKEMGYPHSDLWSDKAEKGDLLSAPTEVHFSITNRCNQKCDHCYMDSGEKEAKELDLPTLKKSLDALAEMGVFHVALGGGEALCRPDLFEVAKHARKIELVPNLTLSGAMVTPEKAKEMTLFGQVNLSIDAVGPVNFGFRNKETFIHADKAIDLLLAENIPTGINCVVGRNNFNDIPQLFEYAKKKGVNEIEFLRFKPSGRALSFYETAKTTFEQNIRLVPMLSKLSRKYGVLSKIDCSFIPMLVWHKPSISYLEKTATYGCEAGNVLLGAKSNGYINGCSFLPVTDVSILKLKENWKDHPDLQQLRNYRFTAAEPCKSCKYLKICKGGCRAVAFYAKGSISALDPDCPKVVRHRQKYEGK